MNVGACTSLPITTAIGRLDLRIGVSLIRRNPCRIKGASVEKSSERPVLTAPRCSTWPPPSIRDIAHATGTKAPEGLMKIVYGYRQTMPDLRWKQSAPSATRTRDLLLRRRFPNVA